MKTSVLVLGLCASLVGAACGGGGDSEPERASGFLEGPAPSEEVLCSLGIGESSWQEVMDTLGEPTSSIEDASGGTLQYWYGDPYTASDLRDVQSLLFVFDEHAVLSAATVSQIPYPACWRAPAE